MKRQRSNSSMVITALVWLGALSTVGGVVGYLGALRGVLPTALGYLGILISTVGCPLMIVGLLSRIWPADSNQTTGRALGGTRLQNRH